MQWKWREKLRRGSLSSVVIWAGPVSEGAVLGARAGVSAGSGMTRGVHAAQGGEHDGVWLRSGSGSPSSKIVTETAKS